MSEPDRDASPRRSQEERRAATRAALVDAGRALFGSRGYADVGTEEIVAAAEVTRGALYHHFDGKAGLFAAVFEEVEEEFVSGFPVEQFLTGDPAAAMAGAVEEYLRLSGVREIQQIALIDGPAVLGWDRWHAYQEQYGLGLIRAALTAIDAAGQLRAVPINEVATALLGALIEGALLVSRADDQDTARARTTTALLALLDGIRADRD